MYTIEFSNQALKDLKKIPKNSRSTILKKLDLMALNPYRQNNNATPLKGNNVFRLRIGDYRAVYELYDQRLVVEVVKVQPRGGVYD